MRRILLAAAVPFLAGLSVARADESAGGGETTASGIAWVHDYDAAKEKAGAEKKGLFVYLTPTWFT
jgi:hypothetical protein